MTTEHTSTTLRFVGDWPWWIGVGGAVTLAVASWVLYRRDVRQMGVGLRLLLPGLRAMSVAMIVLMLSGPVLHHRTVVGQLSRLLLFVDGSQSMTLTDSSMDLGRKIRISQRLGLLRDDAVNMDLPKASDALAEGQSLAQSATHPQDFDTSEWNRALNDFASKMDATRDDLAKTGDNARAEMFRRDLVEPAHELARREMRQIEDRQRAARDLLRLGEIANRWQGELGDLFKKSLGDVASGNSPLQTALQKFDAMPRWQRLQTLLLEGEEKTLSKLAQTHGVELYTLNGGAATKVWQPTTRDSVPPATLSKPEGEVTDLSTGIKTTAGITDQKETETPGAVVLFTDGQHNEGESPVEIAKVLGGRQMPVFPVGFGSTAHAHDLAILKVDAPESVFAEDRVRGQITIKDDMPPGQPFTASIKDGEKVLWEQKLFTENKNLRSVPFDFAISATVKERMKGQREGVEVSGVPLELKVSLSQVEGDREPGNNESSLRVRAVTQRRKILLLDGRPRWEARYLRNMFARDEQWEINPVIAGATRREPGFLRGEKPEEFPADAALLQSYVLINFGDVPQALLKPDELQWIHDFVAQRGGAIIFIDGARGSLKEYAGTPLGPLLPVEWKGEGIHQPLARLTLPDATQSLAAFALAPERAQNLDLWQSLKPPHWLSGATPLPGADVLVEAESSGSAGRLPAVVFRPFGAGRVIYHAFDDSWRWRYELADQNHVRYWNQVANWVAELPFAVRDKFVSLDAGSITYRPGDSADLRVRLRDGEGRPVTNTVVDAVLTRDGKRVATIRLSPDENAGRPLPWADGGAHPGDYEVSVESVAIAERDTKARTSFKVAPRETGELTQLSLNEGLLQQMAAASGGQYLREESIDRLIHLLAPLSQGHVIESETILWQSYWWFVPIILLLTVEWILRKRLGML